MYQPERKGKIGPRGIQMIFVTTLVGALLIKTASGMFWHRFAQSDATAICKDIHGCASITVLDKDVKVGVFSQQTWVVDTGTENVETVIDTVQQKVSAYYGVFDHFLLLKETPVVTTKVEKGAQ